MTNLLRAYVPLVMFAAGCTEAGGPSSGGGEGPGGGGGGAGPASSELAIEVVDERGLAGAGLEVLAHTESGVLTARTLTAGNGTATIEVPAGGLVSVLFDRHNPLLEGEERIVQSVTPPPGREALRFIAYDSQPEDDAASAMQIVIDSGPLAPDESLFVTASCARELELSFPGENLLAVDGYRGCPGSDVFDIYAYRVVLGASDDVVVTGTAFITGQPFSPGGDAELAFDWNPVSFSETAWQLSDAGESTTAYGSAWWRVDQPYILVPELSTQAPFDPSTGTFIQEAAALPAEVQCVSLGLDRDGSVCSTSQRTVCGEAAPATIDWSLSRLAVPELNASGDAWTLTAGEIGDYFEARTSWVAADGALVTWSQEVANDVAVRPTDLELPDDLQARFGRADAEASGVFVSNVDVEGVAGFDAVLDTHGSVPLLPGGHPLTRESVYQRPCPE